MGVVYKRFSVKTKLDRNERDPHAIQQILLLQLKEIYNSDQVLGYRNHVTQFYNYVKQIFY